jgi:hypothetical protein
MGEREEIFSNRYLGLFNDGTIGISDGVGYIDTLSKEETEELGEAIADYFQKAKND